MSFGISRIRQSPARQRDGSNGVSDSDVPLLSDEDVEYAGPIFDDSSIHGFVELSPTRTHFDEASPTAQSLAIALGCPLRRFSSPQELVDDVAIVFFAMSADSLVTGTIGLQAWVHLPHERPCVAVLDTIRGNRSMMRRLLRRIGLATFVAGPVLGPTELDNAIEHARDHVRLTRDLREMRERLALTMRCAHEGFWEWDYATKRLFLSETCREILGYDRGETPGTLDDWVGKLALPQRHLARNMLQDLMTGRASITSREFHVTSSTREKRWVRIQISAQRNANSEVIRICGAVLDITPHRHREIELREQSRTDAVTALPRAPVFFEKLARAIEIARSYPDAGFSVVMIEVHGLTAVHASLGKDAAESALHGLARSVSDLVRDEDSLCRFSSEQLVALLTDDAEEVEAVRLAAAIRRNCEEPLTLPQGHRIHLTTSIGITSSSRDYSNVEDVVTDAAAATAHARQLKARRALRFEPKMRDDARSRLQLENDLRDAVRNDPHQFELQYQPIVNLLDRRVAAFESLIRWRHPTEGIISPVRFIPLAEHNGLILELGRFAVRRAVEQLSLLAKRPALADVAISVNVSGRQATDTELIGIIQESLASCDVNPLNLKVELTESALLEDFEHFETFAKALRKLGVPIFVDDFGTGFSSLSYLQRLSIDGIKIDKSFVDGIVSEPTSRTLVESMLRLADNLGLGVIAEGVEDESQAETLTVLGCELGQGFLFGRPLWSTEALAFAEKNPPKQRRQQAS